MSSTGLKILKERVARCMLRDRHRLLQQWQRLHRKTGNNGADNTCDKLEMAIVLSEQLAARRLAATPIIHYPSELPISNKRQEIAAAIRDKQVVIIAGETGSGKTTQIPKICLELGRGVYGSIGHTQPRRLAARTVASRIADELGAKLGNLVGYQVRFTDLVGELTRIKLMTDGVLLAEISHDPWLNQYDTIIIDEAHERSLNIDFLLGYLKLLLPKRPDLKLIITSATIDLRRFSDHFDGAPVLEVSGRSWPVDVQYLPMESEQAGETVDVQGAVANAVAYIQQLRHTSGPQDILVFLSGEREIRDVHKTLKDLHLQHIEILPLYARLSNSEQNRVFAPHRGQRIILATNVAETSITVPGIRYVVDTGFVRMSRYSLRSRVQSLPIEPVSKASAEQRKGRCGRIAEGLCVRLYSEEDYDNRADFTDPEIVRSNLSAVILQMLSLRLGDIDQFPFVDAPGPKAVRDGDRTLNELGAIEARKITPLGRAMARFPVEPRISRMLIAATKLGALDEVLIIAAALSVQDPRERPLDKQQAADLKHEQYNDENSDFLGYLNLWRTIEEQRQNLSQNQFQKYCRKNFLSWLRIREWRDIHRQLLLVCRDLKLKINQQSADYESIHRALLTGLLGHIGERDNNREYRGAHNRRFYIFPGSMLFKKSPKWVMAAELVETRKLYARGVAKIEPLWVEAAAQHLVKHQYLEPHWEKKRAQPMAYEQVSLYGLILVSRRRVNYGQVDAVDARQIFIRSGLVENQLQDQVAFIKHNRRIIKEVKRLEHKSRRHDIMIDDELIYRFYDENLPAEIHSGRLLSSWLKKSASSAPAKALFLQREYLMRHTAVGVTAEQFPDCLICDGQKLKLVYYFNPGLINDGVTLTLPLAQLGQVSAEQLEWLVPGMLRDKCIAMVKALPKSLRRKLVPVPHHIDQALTQIKQGDAGLAESLALAIQRSAGVEINRSDWDLSRLDDYYLMNIQVLDESEQILAQGRNIYELRRQLASQIREKMDTIKSPDLKREGITGWDFGTLEKEVLVKQNGVRLKVYPAIIDQADSVMLQPVDSRDKAVRLSEQGVIRLLMLETPQQVKYLIKNMPGLKQTELYYTTLGSRQELLDSLLRGAYYQTFLAEKKLPHNRQEFCTLLKQGKVHLVETANAMAQHLCEVMAAHHRICRSLEIEGPKAWHFIYEDISKQLKNLFLKGFAAQVDWIYLQQYPRYLSAIKSRLDKIQDNLSREKVWCKEFDELWGQYETLLERALSTGANTVKTVKIRWLIEEYRVSIYAQKLGTMEPVSMKRLMKKIAAIKE